MYEMNVILVLEALLINAAILGFAIGFTLFGLRGGFEKLFKKKKKWIMPSISEILYMKMDNGEYIYGTNLDIGKYSVKYDCDCEHEYE